MHIELQSISRRYGSQTVIDRLSLRLPSAQLVTLLGPSGCGKTSLLRIIAGLDPADSGRVLFDGQDTSRWSLKERRVGFVFQHYALFPHMSVSDNISFGLRMQKKERKLRSDANTVRAKVSELLALVQLEGLGGRYPHQLSGGQRQRVALARALAIEPRVLLLDEPFGALDAKVRKELRTCLRNLQHQLGITCVLVTHDQEEALEISDQIVLLNQGRIEQEGAPAELFAAPATAFALSFLSAAQSIPEEAPGGASLLVRPHEIEVERVAFASAGRSAEVRSISLRGAYARIELTLREQASPLWAEISREQLERLALEPGQVVYWRPTRVHAFA